MNSIWDVFSDLFRAPGFHETAVYNDVEYDCIPYKKDLAQQTEDEGVNSTTDLSLMFWKSDFWDTQPKKGEIITYKGTDYRVADGISIDSVDKMITIPLKGKYD